MRSSMSEALHMVAFAQMNAIRTYTVPPEWLLSLALESDIRVMVGIPWEQHVTFIDNKNLVKDIEKKNLFWSWLMCKISCGFMLCNWY